MTQPTLSTQIIDEIISIRHDLHAHPELSFSEVRTAAKIEDRLNSWGYRVTSGIAGTGLVASLKQGSSDRSIGLRADMDALPLEESNNFKHRSQCAGKMHACGHDGHVAMLLGAAYLLSQTTDLFSGTVHFIFQPAEEGGGGAQKMIEDGLFERFPCDAVFALHNWPGLPVGQFATRTGPIMASTSEFEIRVIGKGAHAAMPHLGADPLHAAAHLVTTLQGIVSRNVSPVDASVVSVTQFHAGSEATNIIPNEAVIGGTVRTFSLEVLDLVESRLRAIANSVSEAHDCSAVIKFERNYPPTVNSSEATNFALTTMRKLVGDAMVNGNVEPTMGAEDFSYMLLQKPGCYAFIGNGQGDHRSLGHGLGPCMLHNPSYDFNDAIIPLGIQYWVQLVQDYLSK